MIVCNLASGSKGNSTYIETKKHKILIDIGLTCVQMEKCLDKININPNDIDIILITHAHIDHVKGLKVFNKKYNPKIYMSDIIQKEANLEDVNINKLNTLEEIDDICIKEINLSHDVKEAKGYVIEEDNSSIVYITDTGYINQKDFDEIKNKKVYIFESNHDIEMLMNNKNYPHHTKIRILGDRGHLSNKDSAYYLNKIIGEETKYIMLSHISEQNNTEELALSILEETLNKKSSYKPQILIAKQDQISEVLEV